MACNLSILKQIILNQVIRLPFVQSVARRYHNTGRNGNPEEVKYIFDKLAESVDFSGKAVLELGPGQTFGILKMVHGTGANKVVAADIAMYPEAAESGVESVCYNGYHLPFPDESFDVVYSWSVLEHVRYPELVVQEMARVTRKGGVSIHAIDLVDHFYYTSKKPECIFHCLKYPEWLWNAMTWHRSNYVNRLRAGRWHVLFGEAGFSTRVWQPDIYEPAIEWYRQKNVPYLNLLTLQDASTRSVYLVADK